MTRIITHFRLFFFILTFVSFFNCFSQRTLYISSGQTNPNSDGLTEATAFPSFYKAILKAKPGDTFLVMNGSKPYSNTTANPSVNITVSGTSLLPITFKNYPGHTPVIQTTNLNWQGIAIKGSYIVIDGLTVRGLNASQTLESALAQGGSCSNPNGRLEAQFNTNGIHVDGRGLAINDKFHHITIKNCTIYECGGSGIQILQSDYLTIENNKCYNNAWHSIYAPSGISIYQSYNSDSFTGTKIFVKNNICYGNRMYVPWTTHKCEFTDGNGIIIDDSKHGQHKSTLGAYLGRTLVINNVVYNNGGSGIHTFASEHVDIINNTSYHNSQTNEIDNGEIYPQNSNDITIFNNILVSRSNKKINSNMPGNGLVFYDYNLHFGGSITELFGKNCFVKDPKFVNNDLFDFKLDKKSPAINKGVDVFNNTNAPTIDCTYANRPSKKKFDIGAYEF